MRGVFWRQVLLMPTGVCFPLSQLLNLRTPDPYILVSCCPSSIYVTPPNAANYAKRNGSNDSQNYC